MKVIQDHPSGRGFARFADLRRLARRLGVGTLGLFISLGLSAGTNVYLTGVPDYEWFDGCFGTATGNLMGYWDRHGFPNFYTGYTADGVAPLNSQGENYGIRSLWVSKAGLDGRPMDKPGHDDDYYDYFQSAELDPYLVARRPEHEADCLGDFIGLNQNKWKNLNRECDGNVDGYVFVYWDGSGERRVNFTPGPQAGLPALDLQSGLRAWTEWRGSRADTFTQLVELNPEVPSGRGFTFQDLKAEIDAGYPVLFFMQDVSAKSRPLGSLTSANPMIHGLLAYGYYIDDDGNLFVRFRSSTAGGDNEWATWTYYSWYSVYLPPRGVIGYHPQPRITKIDRIDGRISVQWDGPDGELYDDAIRGVAKLHWYVLEVATSLNPPNFTSLTPPTTNHSLDLPEPEDQAAFFRLKLLPPPPRPGGYGFDASVTSP